ncbi:MAG: DEAD/DEAH box helicase [Anaerolineae bacterium]
MTEKDSRKNYRDGRDSGGTSDSPRARFVGGTLVLEGVARSITPPAPFRWINAKWRCPAVHYRTVSPWLRQQGIRNSIPRWRDVALSLYDNREPHPYQAEALQAWLAADRWGSVVLPTGAGKTFLALRAIAHSAVSTLVVVPTLDLLHQWYARLENAFEMPIGVWYGQEKRLEPITVTTYPSAWAHAEALGNQFKLLVFDEIHHLPAPSWHEIALMCASPYRLGLTATYPEPQPEWGRGKRPGFSGKTRSLIDKDPVTLLDELVGPVVYRKHIDDLIGEQLAEYRTERIRIDLTPEERAAYDEAYAIYTGYVREAGLRERHGPGWWGEFTRRSAYEAQARRAKVAELQLKEIVHQAQGKLEILDQLLREHRDQQMLIFTAHNRLAYELARRHLIPVITHQTKAAERKAILDSFRAGTYRAIVTSKVLNEGVDVPEAKIAVVLGGSASAREYIQRLGRVLRKRGNAQAKLYEVIARKTVDEGMARRRRPPETKKRET